MLGSKVSFYRAIWPVDAMGSMSRYLGRYLHMVDLPIGMLFTADLEIPHWLLSSWPFLPSPFPSLPATRSTGPKSHGNSYTPIINGPEETYLMDEGKHHYVFYCHTTTFQLSFQRETPNRWQGEDHLTRTRELGEANSWA
jgi:hypothetical protein